MDLGNIWNGLYNRIFGHPEAVEMDGLEPSLDSKENIPSDVAVTQEPETFIVKDPMLSSALSDLADSVGQIDSRVPVGIHESKYDAVVSIGDYCSGTIVKIEGYEALNSGTLIWLSGHCVENNSTTNPQITVTGNQLLDNGDIESFDLPISTIWKHPHYHDFDREVDIDNFKTKDAALLYSPNPVPEGVTPLTFVPTTMDVVPEGEVASLSDMDGTVISVAGFSRDVVGLHVHKACIVDKVSGSQVLKTDCDMAQGASGGPTFLERDGEITVVAANTAVQGEIAFHTGLREEFLSIVPFITKEGAEGRKCHFTGEAAVETSLNVRYGPDVSFETRATLEAKSPMQIHDIMRNAADEEWGLITDINGDAGYVSMDYVSVDPGRQCVVH